MDTFAAVDFACTAPFTVNTTSITNSVAIEDVEIPLVDEERSSANPGCYCVIA